MIIKATRRAAYHQLEGNAVIAVVERIRLSPSVFPLRIPLVKTRLPRTDLALVRLTMGEMGMGGGGHGEVKRGGPSIAAVKKSGHKNPKKKDGSCMAEGLIITETD